MKTCLNVPVLSMIFIFFLIKGSKEAGDSGSGNSKNFFFKVLGVNNEDYKRKFEFFID